MRYRQRPSASHCPICGVRCTAGEHHQCNPRKLAAIERGRLSELSRIESGYEAPLGEGARIELGAILGELEEARGIDPYSLDEL